MFFYILKCGDNDYFMNQTDDIQQRIAEHLHTPFGAPWTWKYTSYDLVEIFETDDKYKQKEWIARMMKKYNITTIHSGPYTQISFNKSQYVVIKKQLEAVNKMKYNPIYKLKSMMYNISTTYLKQAA